MSQADQANLNFARKVWANLRLGQEFYPAKRFGTPSKWGKIYVTEGNKILKITKWNPNSQHEMNIAKIAGKANAGPRIYNTRKHVANGTNWSVITMDKIQNPKSLYNSINNGTITNFKQVEQVVNRLHRAGIHHGNLHGDNILVYLNKNGKIKLLPINFGASVYNSSIRNMNSAVKFATNSARGVRSYKTPNGRTAYAQPGRYQGMLSNFNEFRALKAYFNETRALKKPSGCFGKFCRK